MSYESFFGFNRWTDKTRKLITGYQASGFTREGIERHLLFRCWQNIPEFRYTILKNGSDKGSFDATLDGNALCHISYCPSVEFPKFENDVTVTWYRGTRNARVEKWSLQFLTNTMKGTLIRNNLKSVNSLNFDKVIPTQITGSTKKHSQLMKNNGTSHNLQNMRNILEFM